MNEQIMPHVIAQSVFPLRKDAIKTACKQMSHSTSFTSGKSSVSTASYLLEKLSLEKSILRNIRLYISLYFILPVSDVLLFFVCLNKSFMKQVMTATV